MGHCLQRKKINRYNVVMFVFQMLFSLLAQAWPITREMRAKLKRQQRKEGKFEMVHYIRVLSFFHVLCWMQDCVSLQSPLFPNDLKLPPLEEQHCWYNALPQDNQILKPALNLISSVAVSSILTTLWPRLNYTKFKHLRTRIIIKILNISFIFSNSSLSNSLRFQLISLQLPTIY